MCREWQKRSRDEDVANAGTAEFKTEMANAAKRRGS